MSNTYLALFSDRPRPLDDTAEAAATYLPFIFEDKVCVHDPKQQRGFWAWSVLPEAARGSFWAIENDEVVTFNGWFAEDAPSLQTTVAEHARDTLANLGPARFAQSIAGDWSLLRLHRDGSLDGICDFLGGQHLYYGQRNGLIAVSNRALVCAAALHDGELPAPDPLFLSWLLTATAAPVGPRTPFEGVYVLDPGSLLKVEHQTITTRPLEPISEVPCWTQATHEFEQRVAQINNLPDLRWAMALTGGKDSRLILSALAASGALDRVEYAFLRALPDHPDVSVGRKLAEHFDLEFRLFEPLSPDEDFLDTIARHNFQTEFALNAWDVRGRDRRERISTLHGSYGEIYRGHANFTFLLGWRAVRAKYLRPTYIDIAGILTEEAHQHCHQGLSGWIEDQRQQKTGLLHLHDTFHIQMRMHRWMGQVQTNNACATVMMAPIPSASLLAKYQGLSIRDRQYERVHFELMHRCDRWLAAQPFANDQWSRFMPAARCYRAKPFVKASHQLSRQMTYWKTHSSQIQDFLRDTSPSRLFEIVDRQRLHNLLERAGESPDFVTLRAILATTAIRQALDGPVKIRPVTVEPA